MNPKAGCAGSVLNLLEVEGFNHQVKTTKQRKMLAKQEAQQMQEQKTEEQ